jgi:pectate lyase
VENNVFVSTKKALFSTDDGFVVSRGNDFGGAINGAVAGTLTAILYTYTLDSLNSVRTGVPPGAGANLYF